MAEYRAQLRRDGSPAVEILVTIADITDPSWSAIAWHQAGPPFISLGAPGSPVTVELRTNLLGHTATASMHPPVAEAAWPAKALEQVELHGMTAFAPPAD